MEFYKYMPLPQATQDEVLEKIRKKEEESSK